MQLNNYIILCAGKGARLWPITQSIPKAMIRVLGMPVCGWIVKSIYENAKQIVIVVSTDNDGNKITEYLSDSPWKTKIKFVKQIDVSGTAKAILCAKELLNEDEPFVVLNGDTFAEPEFYKKINENIKSGNWFLMGKKVEDASSLGLLEIENGRLTGIVEKPVGKTNGIINTGCFYAPNKFWKCLENVKISVRAEYEATDAILEFCKENSMKVVEFAGYWNDVGYFWNYLDSNAFAMDKLMEEGILSELDKDAVIRGKVFVAKNSQIKAGTVIEGPVYIGPNCTIGPNATLRPYSFIEGNNHIGTGTEIKNSIVLENSDAHGAYIGDSIICSKVNLGAGTRIANLKFDESTITTKIKGKTIDSKRRKLGVVIGQGTKTGVNVSINCGVLIGNNCRIYPNNFVKTNLDNDTIFNTNE